MAYPYYNGYPMGYYQPMQNQYQQPMQTSQTVAQAPAQTNSGGIIWVQGEEAAKAYMVAAGNSVLLMDSEGSTFYLKSSDAQGMPMPLRIFDYTERTAQKPVQAQTISPDEYVTRKEFVELSARLDSLAASKQTTKRSAQKEETSNG